MAKKRRKVLNSDKRFVRLAEIFRGGGGQLEEPIIVGDDEDGEDDEDKEEVVVEDEEQVLRVLFVINPLKFRL